MFKFKRTGFVHWVHGLSVWSELSVSGLSELSVRVLSERGELSVSGLSERSEPENRHHHHRNNRALLYSALFGGKGARAKLKSCNKRQSVKPLQSLPQR